MEMERGSLPRNSGRLGSLEGLHGTEEREGRSVCENVMKSLSNVGHLAREQDRAVGGTGPERGRGENRKPGQKCNYNKDTD